MRHHQRLAEVHHRRTVGQVDGAARTQHVELQAQHGEQARQRGHKARHAEPVEKGRVEQAEDGPDGKCGQDGDPDRPSRVDPQHAHHGGREAADGTHRKVDLADHQDANDAERDHADRGAVEQQVDEIVARQEDRVEALEHRPDDGQPDNHRERTEVARADTVKKAADRAADAGVVPDPGIGAVEERRGRFGVDVAGHARSSVVSSRSAWRRPERRETALSAAPVMALTSSWFDVSG